jgi:hypothetical protein
MPVTLSAFTSQVPSLRASWRAFQLAQEILRERLVRLDAQHGDTFVVYLRLEHLAENGFA